LILKNLKLHKKGAKKAIDHEVEAYSSRQKHGPESKKASWRAGIAKQVQEIT
jgi:hypothetical protein